MHAATSWGVAAAALVVEAALGYPPALFRAIGHPVVWIGTLIARLDRALNCPTLSAGARRRNGVAALALVLAVATVPAAALGHWPVLAAAGAALLLAQRSLDAHVAAVADALDREGLAASRRAVAMIVGRDPDRLDEAGVARAAIESLAENFSDGVVAPALWCGLLGLPGIVAYKAINTADSMIGHRTPRHEAFGWAAARLDDVVNLPASRLSAVWIAAAAWVHPDANARLAWRAVRRDARRHRSPNAGWPEAAMAGALGLRLAGPRAYDGALVADAWMGDGRAHANAGDIRRALALYRIACVLQVCALALAAVMLASARG